MDPHRLQASYRSLEVYVAIAVVYFVLTNLTGLALQQAERRLGVGGLLR